MPDLVQDHTVDQAGQILSAFRPVIQNKAAVEVQRILTLAVRAEVADDGRPRALIASHQVKGRFQFQLLLDEVIRKVLDEYFQFMNVLVDTVRQGIHNVLRNLLNVFKRRRYSESHKDCFGFQLTITPKFAKLRSL